MQVLVGQMYYHGYGIPKDGQKVCGLCLLRFVVFLGFNVLHRTFIGLGLFCLLQKLYVSGVVIQSELDFYLGSLCCFFNASKHFSSFYDPNKCIF